MKKKVNVCATAVLCAVIITVGICLNSCGLANQRLAKEVLSDVNVQAGQNVQWMPMQASSILHFVETTGSEKDSEATEKTTIVTVQPSYAWYYKTARDDKNLCFLSLCVHNGKVYGAVVSGPKETSGSQAVLQYEITDAAADNVIALAKSSLQDLNTDANKIIKDVLSEAQTSSSAEYSADEDDINTDITNKGTLYSCMLSRGKSMYSTVTVGVQNDNKDVYSVSVQNVTTNTEENYVIRGRNGFNDDQTVDENIELEKISLEEFLQKTETLPGNLTDPVVAYLKKGT